MLPLHSHSLPQASTFRPSSGRDGRRRDDQDPPGGVAGSAAGGRHLHIRHVCTIWATSPTGPCPGGICQDSGECVCSRLSGNIFFVNNNKNNKTQPYVVFLKGTQTTRTRGFRCPCIPPAYTTKYPCIYIYIYILSIFCCAACVNTVGGNELNCPGAASKPMGNSEWTTSPHLLPSCYS